MSESRRRGIFALIRSRQDALNIVTDASIVFLLVAAVLAALYLIEGERTLLDVGLFGFLGVLLWRFRSPAAAFALLLIAIMRFFVTVGQAIETGAVNWTYVIVTIVVLFASIRAIEATLKLIGRFATTKRADN